MPQLVARQLSKVLWATQLVGSPPSFLDFLLYLCVADGAKAKAELGFTPRLSFKRTILDFLGVIGFYGLPLTYLEDYVVRVQQVGAGDIRDAFARRVDPARMATVVVGADPASLR